MSQDAKIFTVYAVMLCEEPWKYCSQNIRSPMLETPLPFGRPVEPKVVHLSILDSLNSASLAHRKERADIHQHWCPGYASPSLLSALNVSSLVCPFFSLALAFCSFFLCLFFSFLSSSLISFLANWTVRLFPFNVFPCTFLYAQQQLSSSVKLAKTKLEQTAGVQFISMLFSAQITARFSRSA